MTETEYRDKLRAMTAQEHFDYFQQAPNGERLRNSLKGSAPDTFRACSQEAVDDLRAFLYWEEWTGNNVPVLNVNLVKHEFFLFEQEENVVGNPVTNQIVIVCTDTECYTPIDVSQVNFNSGYHTVTPVLGAMQNNEEGNCTTKLK